MTSLFKSVARPHRDGRATRNVLVFLLALLGSGALGGGFALIASPNGAMLGMPLPGIVLFFVLGLVPIGVAYALLREPACELAEATNCFSDMHWAWAYSVYIAFALIIWIQLEMFFLGAVHWLHGGYVGLALLILFVALLPQVRAFYRIERR